jgi:hypothetical protein
MVMLARCARALQRGGIAPLAHLLRDPNLPLRGLVSEAALEPTEELGLTPDQVGTLPKAFPGGLLARSPLCKHPVGPGHPAHSLKAPATGTHMLLPPLIKLQVEFKNVADSFVRDELLPFSAQWDREHHFPVDTLRRAAELGFAGLWVSEEHGGALGLSWMWGRKRKRKRRPCNDKRVATCSTLRGWK